LNYQHPSKSPPQTARECKSQQLDRLQKYLPENCNFRPEERYAFTVPVIPEDIRVLQEKERNMASPFFQYSGKPNSGRTPAPVIKTEPKIGRNDPCPCGSGKKYKKCCMLKNNNMAP